MKREPRAILTAMVCVSAVAFATGFWGHPNGKPQGAHDSNINMKTLTIEQRTQ